MYVFAGGEYEYNGVSWVLTGRTFWVVLAVVPYTTLSWNVTSWNGTSSLNPNVNYFFRVSAGNLNADGYGPHTEAYSAAPANIPLAVKDVVISNPSNTYFALNFDSSSYSLTSVFKVLIYDLTNGSSFYYSSVISQMSVILDGLWPGTTYSVRVFAGNLAGYETVGTVSTSSVTTSATPSNLTIRFVSSLAITIFWTAPPNLADLQYLVSFIGSVSGTVQHATVVGNTAQASLSVSAAQPSYTFTVLGGSLTLMDSQALEASMVVPMQLNLGLSNLRVLSVSNSSAYLEWTLESTETITSTTFLEMQYSVQVSTDNFANQGMQNTRQYETFVLTTDLSATTPVFFNATDLTADILYSCRVLVASPYGTFTSNIANILPTNQPGPVSALEISSVSYSSVHLKWLPPPFVSGSAVENYCIQVKPVFLYSTNNNLSCQIYLNFTTLSWNITGLVTNEIYIFSIRAKNLNFKGYGDPASVEGGPSGPPFPPVSLRLIEVESDAIHFCWQPPNALPSPTSYQIQYKKRLALISSPFVFGGNSFSTDYVLTALQAQTEYQIRACAIGKTVLGLVQSSCSDVLYARTSPPPVSGVLIAEGVTNDSVTLSWSPADDGDVSWVFIPNKDSLGYDLQCVSGNVSHLKILCELNPLCAGFVTNGCLKSRIGLESELVEYLANITSVGYCCPYASISLGCTAAGNEFVPQPVCGCRCSGIWTKGVQYLLQQSGESGVFATVDLGVNEELATTISRPKNCSYSCESCPSSCVQITGLVQHNNYKFRVLARNLNKAGFTYCSSNILNVAPVSPPERAVSDFQVVFTTVDSVQFQWTGISGEDVTKYRLQIGVSASTNNSSHAESEITWYSTPVSLFGSQILSQEYNHVAGENSGDVEGLVAGNIYWFRLQSRNLNFLGYQGSPVSNAVSAIPYGPIGSVSGVRVLQVAAAALSDCCSCCSYCESIQNSMLECCQCCGSTVCRGLADVSLVWRAPSGPVTGYRIQVAYQENQNTTSSFQTAAVVDVMNLEYTISSLLVGRKYAFQVQAASSNIDDYCAFHEQSTYCSWFVPSTCLWYDNVPCPSTVVVIPYMAPTVSVQASLIASNITESSVVLSWDAVVSEPVTTYQVQYASNFESQKIRYAEVIQTKGRISIFIQHLNRGQPYFFFVIPRNLNPAGYAECPSIVDPSQISWYNMGGGSYLIQWTAPTSNGASWFPPILSYKIWIRPKGNNETYSFYQIYNLTSTSSPLSYYVTGLDPFTIYEFSLTPSAWPCAMIGPIIPDYQELLVKNFSAVLANESSISFFWDGELIISKIAILNGYELAVSNTTWDLNCEQETYLAKNTIYLQAPLFAIQSSWLYTFTGLVLNTQYCFRIRAVSLNVLTRCPPVYVREAPVAIPNSVAKNLSLIMRDNVGWNQFGASVQLSWSLDTSATIQDQIKKFRIAAWMESDQSCDPNEFYRASVPCESCKNFFQESNVTVTTSTSSIVGNISGLRPGESYFFKVYTGNLNGFEEIGSSPLGPIRTSSRPGAARNLTISSVTNDSVSLLWSQPMFPYATKQKLYRSDLNGENIINIESACTLNLQPCVSSFTWTNLTLNNKYVFKIFSGGPYDPIMPDNSPYSGVATVIGAPIAPCLPAQTLEIESWDSSSIRIAFGLPARSSVLGIFVEGAVASNPEWFPTNHSGIVISGSMGLLELIQNITVFSVGGVSLKESDGKNSTLYSFRIVAFNANGNSTPAYLYNVRIYPAPTQVQNFSRYFGPFPGIHTIRLSWSPPQQGFWVSQSFGQLIAVAGFQYRLETSDDGGLTFYEDIAGPLGYMARDINVSFVNRPSPLAAQVIQEGRTYIFRISARNLNSQGYGPYAYLRVYKSTFPSQIQSLNVLQASSNAVVLSWTAPHGISFESPEESVPTYVCEASVFSFAPYFIPLGGNFKSISTSFFEFTLLQVQHNWPNALAALGVNNTRFWIRIRSINSAGPSSLNAPMVEVDFRDIPTGEIAGFSAYSASATSISLSWRPVLNEESLVGYRVCQSSDHVYYSQCKIVPSIISFGNMSTILNSQIDMNNLDPNRYYWFEISEVGLSGQSSYFSPAGPYNTTTVTPAVIGLSSISMNQNSVLIGWAFPDSFCTWSVDYYETRFPGLVWSQEVQSNSVNISGLSESIQYTFDIRARSIAGFSSIESLNATIYGPPSSVLDLDVVNMSNGSVTLMWNAVLVMSPLFLVTFAPLNPDGDINGEVTYVQKQETSMQRKIIITGRRKIKVKR